MIEDTNEQKDAAPTDSCVPQVSANQIDDFKTKTFAFGQRVPTKSPLIDLVSDGSSDEASPGPSRKKTKNQRQSNEAFLGPSRKKTKNERQSNEGSWASSTTMDKNEKGNNEQEKSSSGECFADTKKSKTNRM